MGQLNSTQVNPYVGPRSFTVDQAGWFKGRDAEANDLLSLLLARRVMLFFAQSGAGKTSLLNAKLIPMLEDEKVGFEVLTVGRMGDAIEPPENTDASFNIFTFNLAVSLGVTDKPEHLAGVRLSDFLLDIVSDGKAFRYVGRHEEGEEETAVYPELSVDTSDQHLKRRVLIIDQFEEIFTVHPERERERIAFFKQVSEAMAEDPYLYVLFSMRGDYIDRLSPYVKYLPDSLRTRYYMERMREQAALDAVCLPAEKEGRSFEIDVAQKLVQCLRGSDLYVETVQLQVVCLQLWQSLATIEGEKITMDNVVEIAANLTTREPNDDSIVQETADPLVVFIDNAMASYYQQAINAILHHPDVSMAEHELRNWFSTKLITASGTRNLLARGETETDGIPEAVVKLLDEDYYLVRNDMRGGRPFIELVHDSFVEPIRRANRQWEANRTRNITWLTTALRYHKTQDDALLLKGAQLTAARSQAMAIQGLPAEAEAYLAASEEAQKEEEQKARQQEEIRQLELAKQQQMAELEKQRANEAEAAKVMQRWLLVLTAVIGIVAIFFAFHSQSQAQIAEIQTTKTFEEAATSSASQAELTTIQARVASEDATRAAEQIAAAEARATEQAVVQERLNNLLVSVELANRAEKFLNNNNSYGALLLSHMATDPVQIAPEIIESNQGTMLKALYLATNQIISLPIDSNDEMLFERELPLPTFSFSNPMTITTLGGSISGRLAYLEEDTLVQWDIAEISSPETSSVELPEEDNIHSASFNDITQRLVTANEDILTFWVKEDNSWQPIHTEKLENPEKWQDVIFNPKGEVVAAVSCKEAEECYIHSWQINDNQPISNVSQSQSIGRHKEILGLAFINEGIVWSSPTEFGFYSLSENEAPPLPSSMPDYTVQSMAFIGSQNWLVVGGSCNDEFEQCGFVRWWSLKHGEWLTQPLKQTSPVQQLLYDEASSSLVAVLSSQNGPVLLAWETRPTVWREIACNLTGRNLTQAEWQEAFPGQEFEKYPLICSNIKHSSVINRLVDESEQTLSSCNAASKETAQAQYEAARPGENFASWAVPILLGTALKEIRLTNSCIEQIAMLIPDSDFNGEEFVQILNVLNNNENFDYELYLEQRQGVLFEPAITLLDQYVAQQVYQTPCFTEDFLRKAEDACTHYNELLAQSGQVENFVPIEPTERSGDTHVWAFEFDNPGFVVINFAAQEEESYPSLALHNSQDVQIAFIEGSESITFDSLLPEAGSYTIRVHWDIQPSNYTLLVETLKPKLVEANTITSGAANQQVWQFEAFADDFVNVKLTASETASAPYLYLYDPNGRDIGQYQDTLEISTAESILSEDGLYTIVVRWGNTSSNYELSLEATPPMPIEVGADAVSAEASQRIWRFVADQSNLVTINLNTTSPNTYPLIEVYDSDNNLIDSTSGFEMASLITLLPKNGLYTIKVKWDSEPSPYTLSVETTPPTTIVIGENGVAEVNAESYQRVWQFDGAPENSATVSLNAEELDAFPFITLYDPDGNLIGFGSGYEKADLESFLLKDGLYTIVIGWDSAPSSYSFMLSLVPEPLTLQQIPNDDFSEEADAEQQWWQFGGEAGTLVVITMEALEENGDTYLRLFDENGNEIASNDDFEGLNSQIEIVLPEDGLYYIQADWFDDIPGRYRLTVTK